MKLESKPFFFPIFYLFFVGYLLAQHWLIYPYHDDWGYAVLSYTTEVEGGVGQKFSQLELLKFLFQEYQNWSGRFFPFFLQINLFKIGLEAVRAVQVLVISIIFLTAVMAVRRGSPWCMLLFVTVIYYLALPRFVTVGGLYWFSASIAYAWGVALFGIALYLIERADALNWRATGLLALAALFHEQMAVAMPAFVLSYIALTYWKRRKVVVLLKMWPNLAVVTLAGALVIFAPGNFSRRAVSSYNYDGLVSTMWANLNDISALMLHAEGRVAALFCLLAWAIFWLKFSNHMAWRISYCILGFLTAVVMLASFGFVSVGLMLCFWLLSLGFVLAAGTCQGWVSPGVASAFAAAIASLILLLLAPGISSRTLLTFYLLMLTPIVYSISLCRNRLGLSVMIIVGLLGAAGFLQSAEVYRGYAINAPYHEVNHAKLLAAGFDVQQGTAIDTITLYRLPAERFAETMPYQRDIIGYWLRRYYRLPDGISMEWHEPVASEL